MLNAVYPGSFDPITFGHVDIIRRLQSLFDSVHVLIADSEDKHYLFDPQERKELIARCLDDQRGITFEICRGLTVDYAKKLDNPVLIRGLRTVGDFEHEMAMANTNKALNSDIETLTVFADPRYSFVASRFAKEIAKHGGDLSNFVPPAVAEALKTKFH